MRYHRWTAEDDEVIRAEYSTTLAKLLAVRLGTTEGAVFWRAFKLGVRKQEHQNWRKAA